MASDDPFTQVTRAIIDALKTHESFVAMVKPNNLIDMSAASFTLFKEQVQAADLPEVLLLQGSFTMKFGNARSASIDQSFELLLTHDTLKTVPVNALKWETFRALARRGDDLRLGGLVRDWRVTSGRDDAFGQPEWTRNTKRWVTVLTVVVSMDVARASL